ncbi:MAG: hypothetical protein J0H14_19420 [Alphaproteobacteria bacterium]|nr:hypothetical protein [Alphaproteobacteria bacterium]
MRMTVFLSAMLLGLAVAAPAVAQTGNEQGAGPSSSAAPDRTAPAAGYTGHGRMGNKRLGSSESTGKGGPSENAGSGRPSQDSRH